MKKIISFTLSLALLACISASAQVFRLGVGLAGVSVSDSKAGIHMPLLDLGYAPNPSMEFGLYTGIGLDADYDELESLEDDEEISGGFRFGVQGKYYFMTEKAFRPYVGLQAGLLAGATVIKGSDKVEEKETKFQVTPMAGFRLGPLNAWASYMNKSVYANVGLIFGFGSFR